MASKSAVFQKWLYSGLLFLSFAMTASMARANEYRIGLETHVVEINNEDGLFTVDHAKFSDTLMQETVGRWSFTNEDEAYQKYSELTQSLQKKENPRPAPRPLSPTEEDEFSMSPVIVEESFGPVAGEGSPQFVTEDSSRVVWKSTQNWSWQWEQQYAAWISKELTPDFFSRYNISTDCADVAIGLRWIFSRIHGLPVGNSLAASGRLFTNESFKKSWSTLATAKEWHKDQLFLAALDYIMDGAYTKSLLIDSYPVAITPKTFLPGVYHLQFHDRGGHTMIVKKVQGALLSPPLQMLQSTLPRAPRKLKASAYHMSEVPFGAGFLRQRWLVKSGGTWELLSSEAHPDFSYEQWEEDFLSASSSSSFSGAIKARVLGKVNPMKDYRSSSTLWTQKINERAKIVVDGYATCSQTPCAVGTEAFDEWSTFVRDEKLLDLTRLIDDLAKDSPQVQTEWNKILKKTFSLEGKSVSLEQLVTKILEGRLNGDPGVTPTQRWGF